MSVATEVAIHGGGRRRPLPRQGTGEAVQAERPLLRLVTFSALALYGVLRWAVLENPAPGFRLIGMLALAVLVAGAGPWLDARSRPLAIVAAGCASVAMLAIAGIPVAWLIHARVAVIARGIGSGVSALPGVLLPYLGVDEWVKAVMALGAGVLLLDAAIMIAFAPRALGDLRRGAAALPLIALAVIPSTLLRPQLPYIQGLILFALVAAFMWGERIAPGRAAGAVVLAGLAALAAAFIAPGIDAHHPWVNPRNLASSFAPTHVDTFDWSQHYGPFSWPRDNRTVLDVKASRPDYWKAENLDVFNGIGWGQGSGATGSQAPGPSAKERGRFSQTLQVTLRSMTTTDVIAGGFASPPEHVDEDVLHGTSPGTWVTGTALPPGKSYAVRTYSPAPSGTELATDRGAYPAPALAGELAIGLPPKGGLYEIRFPMFHSGAPVLDLSGPPGTSGASLIDSSPYAAAYALASRLAQRAATPYGFALAVEQFLSQSNGFSYDENPPQSSLPLETFLFSSHRGYCQQFAGAMALLLRMGGVPARVATGFTTGTYSSATRQYVVSDLDAHAWVEVWFPRYGWVRFDPTPGNAPARAGSSAVLPALSGTLPIGRAPKPGQHAPRADTTSGRRAGPRSLGGGPPLAALVAGLVVVLALVALLARALLREATPHELVVELARALSRTGRSPRGGLTLRALEQRFRGSPDAERYVRRLRLARFAGDQELPRGSERRALRGELAAGLGLMGKIRAWWALPPRVLH